MTAHDEGQEQLILDMVGRFLEQEVRPHVWQLEHDDIYPVEIVEKMKAMGLFGCLIAPEYGGLGLSTVTYARIIERISEEWMSLSGILNSHRSEEHTSELQSLMRISYAVLCLKNKTHHIIEQYQY